MSLRSASTTREVDASRPARSPWSHTGDDPHAYTALKRPTTRYVISGERLSRHASIVQAQPARSIDVAMDVPTCRL